MVEAVSCRGMKLVRDSERPYRGSTAAPPVIVGERGFLNPPEAIFGYNNEGGDRQTPRAWKYRRRRRLTKHVLHQTPPLSSTFASLSSLFPHPGSASMFDLLLRLASGPPQMRHLECQRVVPGPGTTPGSNIATPFLHPGHPFPVPKGVSMLRSGLVAAAESVRAEIGRGREVAGLLAGTEDTDVLGWCD